MNVISFKTCFRYTVSCFLIFFRQWIHVNNLFPNLQCLHLFKTSTDHKHSSLVQTDNGSREGLPHVYQVTKNNRDILSSDWMSIYDFLNTSSRFLISLWRIQQLFLSVLLYNPECRMHCITSPWVILPLSKIVFKQTKNYVFEQTRDLLWALVQSQWMCLQTQECEYYIKYFGLSIPEWDLP